MRTTLVGSWPPEARYRADLARYYRGELDDDTAERLLTDVATVAIAQQRACGVDEMTGGETSADSFILHFPRVLSGIVPSENTTAWDGRGTFRIVGPISAPQGLGIASAFERERRIDPQLEKVTIPGPSEITTMLEPRETARAAWPAVIELIRAEVRALVDMGARDIQLDVPQIAMGLADGGWDTAQAVDTISAVFEGVHGVRRSVHLCYGDFGARTWARHRELRPLLPTLQKLSGSIDRMVLELSLPEQWAEHRLLADLDETIEIAAGIVDVKNPRVETVDELARMTEDLLRLIAPERLLLCPSCGLGRRSVQLAIDKTTVMVACAHRF
jgi:5-methyltetrahydropteroyltriglutamate--homocysteine methyltransferase